MPTVISDGAEPGFSMGTQQVGGPQNPARNWAEASARLESARADIVALLEHLRPECVRTLALVGMNAGQLVAAAQNVVILDAFGVAGQAATRASLYANTGAAAAAVDQYGGQTIRNWFQASPGTMAAADLNGNRVFFRSAGVDAISLGYNVGLLAHELIHNASGLADDVIMARLGIVQDPRVRDQPPSAEVSRRLTRDCF